MSHAVDRSPSSIVVFQNNLIASSAFVSSFLHLHTFAIRQVRSCLKLQNSKFRVQLTCNFCFPISPFIMAQGNAQVSVAQQYPDQRIFSNGILNPRYDPEALRDFSLMSFESPLYVSESNPNGEFPLALTEGFMYHYLEDILIKIEPSTGFGFIHHCYAEAFQCVRVNFNVNSLHFDWAVVATAQRFNIHVPNPYTPLTQDELVTLPFGFMGYDNYGFMGSQICLVCFNHFNIGEVGINLPCYHFFHPDCLIDFLKQRASCPYCFSPARREVFENGIRVRIEFPEPPVGGVLGVSAADPTSLTEMQLGRLAREHLTVTMGPGNIFAETRPLITHQLIPFLQLNQ